MAAPSIIGPETHFIFHQLLLHIASKNPTMTAARENAIINSRQIARQTTFTSSTQYPHMRCSLGPRVVISGPDKLTHSPPLKCCYQLVSPPLSQENVARGFLKFHSFLQASPVSLFTTKKPNPALASPHHLTTKGQHKKTPFGWTGCAKGGPWVGGKATLKKVHMNECQ